MKFLTRGLSEEFTYPCSKVDVKTVLGDELLDSACFGIRPQFRLEARYTPRPEIQGTVILDLTVREGQKGSLFVFRAPKAEFTEETHASVVDVLKGPMRDWLQVKLNGPVTALFGTQVLLVELRDGQLLLHETQYR